jgi:hypothetical protein
MVSLSKSKYLTGLQCPLLLWLTFNEPSALPPVDAATQAVFDQGHDVGDYAKQLFPGGVEVAFADGFKQTLERTQTLVKERAVIFEASFSARNLYARADILVPVESDAWDIIEVKSSTSVKDVNLEDVAFQRFCYEAAGLKVRNCFLMTIDNTYVRQGPIDPARLLKTHDITAQVDALVPLVPAKVKAMFAIIGGPKPAMGIGPHCSAPYACVLTERCWAFLPKHNVTELYYAKKLGFELLGRRIHKIADIPADVKLGAKQQVQKDAVVSGTAHIEPAQLQAFLKTLSYSRSYLDFETFNDAIPRFDGLRPYQQVPFQYSLHIDDGKKHEGNMSDDRTALIHKEFLATDGDPREEFLNALQRDLPSSGSIIAYNASFEVARLNELAAAFPAHATWIRGAVARVVDLLTLFRNFSFYHPEQHGSCSIKDVLPALCGTDYSGLEIGDGNEASREFARVTYGSVPVEERKRVRAALLTYCKQDTQAMVDVVKVLEKTG